MAVTRLHSLLRGLLEILCERLADINHRLDPTLVVSCDVTPVAGSRLNQFTLSGHRAGSSFSCPAEMWITPLVSQDVRHIVGDVNPELSQVAPRALPVPSRPGLRERGTNALDLPHRGIQRREPGDVPRWADFTRRPI